MLANITETSAGPVREQALERGCFDHAVAIDRNALRTGNGLQHALMLDRRHQHALVAAQRHVVGLGAARGKDDLARQRADKRSHLLARLVDAGTGSAARAMDRRWIAAGAQRLDHGVERHRPQRAGRVVVEVGVRGGHDAASWQRPSNRS